MNYFNKEQLEKLQPLEKVFEGCIKSGVKKGTTKAENELVQKMINELNGVEKRRNLSCGRCMFNLYKEVGQLYFASLEKVQLELEPKVINNDLETEVQNVKPRKTNKRKKKPVKDPEVQSPS